MASLVFLFRLYRMHEMLTIVIDDYSVCLSAVQLHVVPDLLYGLRSGCGEDFWWPKEYCIRWGFRSTYGKGEVEWDEFCPLYNTGTAD